MHHHAAAMHTYGDFQETSRVLFKIFVMISLNSKQLPGFFSELSSEFYTDT